MDSNSKFVLEDSYKVFILVVTILVVLVWRYYGQAGEDMFFDVLSKIGTSTISIPIFMLSDSSGQIISTIGIGIPAVSISNLAKIGLFDHSVAEKNN